mgnify:CR=1 FL=1
MMTTLNQIFRLILFVFVGIVGMLMAMVFMVSTAIAIGVLYIVARIRGRPFGVRAYWDERRAGQYTYRQAGPHAYRRHHEKDVIDVEAREIP